MSNADKNFFSSSLAYGILLFAIVALPSCGRENRPVLTTFSGIAMTMTYRILIGNDLDLAQQQRVKEIIEMTFDEIDAICNNWNPLSEVSYLNTLSADVDFPLSPQLYAFLQRVDALVKATDGAFDPTVATLVAQWRRELESGRLLSQEEIETERPNIGWHHISFDQGIFRKAREGVHLDFGGVAKGYAIDLLLERLMAEGWGGVYVEWGGEIAAAGRHPSGRPWQICISRFGDHNADHALAHVSIEEAAMATSGDYYQWWEVDGERYTHILNPKSGSPLPMIQATLSSVSIIAPTCLTADALATAAMVWSTASHAGEYLDALQKEGILSAYWLCEREGAVISSICNERHLPPTNLHA